MKKPFFAFLFVLCSCLAAGNCLASPGETRAEMRARISTLSAAQKEDRLAKISARVEEIKSMDLSVLSREEKKELRQELRSMKYEAEAMHSRRVIFTAGAIVVVIIAIVLIF